MVLTQGLRLTPGLRHSPAHLGNRSSDSSCYTSWDVSWSVENSGMLILLSTLSPATSCSCCSAESPSTLDERMSHNENKVKSISPCTPQGRVSARVLRAGNRHAVIVIVIVQVNMRQVVLKTVKLRLLLLRLNILPLGMDRLRDLLQVPQTLGVLRFALRYFCLQRTDSRLLAIESLNRNMKI